MDTSSSVSGFRPRAAWGLPVFLMIAGAAALLLVLAVSSRTVAGSGGKAPAAADGTVPSTEEILAALPPAPPEADADFASRLTKAVDAVRSRPEVASGWVQLGDLLAQAQRDTQDPAYFTHAENAYQAALRLEPGGTEAMAGQAWVYGGKHQFDLSILQAEKVLEAHPDHATAHGIIGDAAVELGDYDRAFTEYQKMMDLRPDLSSWSRGASLLWLTGNPSKAILLMEQAVRSGGPYAENTAWCRARLALMLFHDGSLQPAAQALAPALAGRTRNGQVLLMAGRLAAAAGEFDTARQYYEEVLTRGPNLEALTGLGDVAAAQGRADEAGEFYAKVEALHLAHRESGVHDHMEMARFYADHNIRPEEALRLAVEHGEPRNVFEFDTLAWVHHRNGNQEKAAKYIKLALKHGTPDAAMQYHAGCIAAASGDRVSAQKHLSAAQSMNPHFNLVLAPEITPMLEKLGDPSLALTPPPAPAGPEVPPRRPLERLR